MINTGLSAELDLGLLADIAPFLVLVDGDLEVVWASPAIVRRVATALGMSLFDLLRHSGAPEPSCDRDLDEIVGQIRRFSLLSEEADVPLIGRWLACHGGHLLLANPDPATREELSLFHLDEFLPDNHFVELLVGQDETRISLDQATAAAAALKLKNKDLEESRARTESANAALETEIAERLKAERALAAINDELSHFAYVVSHDLKAPLRGIKLVTEWLCADYGDKLGDEAKEQIELLQSRVARMHNLIDGVLQYSRVGRITEETTQVDLNELIAGIVDGIAPPEHVHIAVESPLPSLKGEKTRITQVFQNLLSNAVKFMDKPVGEVRIACVEDGEFWRFSVADNGPGIEHKYFDQIFRLFQTLTPRDEFESTGVGLALVKKIVEMYGGRIWIESVVGQGSTFFVTFPKNAGTVEPAPPAVAAG